MLRLGFGISFRGEPAGTFPKRATCLFCLFVSGKTAFFLFVFFQITLDSNRTAFCFDNYYSEETPGDCIIGPPPSPTKVFSNSSLVSRLLDDDKAVKLSSTLRSVAPRRLCVTSVKIPYETFDVSVLQCRKHKIYYKLKTTV